MAGCAEMKRIALFSPATLFLAVFLLTVATCAAAFAEPATQSPLRLRSVQADFIQEKHLKILARPLVSKGSFTFQTPQSLRWEYFTPIHSILLMHEGKIRKFVERDGKMVEDQGMGLDSMQVVLSEISNWLDGRFTENSMFSVTFPDQQTVILTPKNQGFAALISSIELKLGRQAGLLDQVTIYEGTDSSTLLAFSNRTLNQEIPASRFSLQ